MLTKSFLLAIALWTTAPVNAMELDYGRICLALVAFSEQSEKHPDGMLLVQLTVVNRLMDKKSRYGESLCDVAQQEHQFDGIQQWATPRTPWVTNPQRWAMAMDIANRIIDRRYEIPGQCVSNNPILYFHSGEPPYWTNELDFVCFVDGHYFYSETEHE